jgi:FlaA1/EpsC-like NDP-sugar epimerase
VPTDSLPVIDQDAAAASRSPYAKAGPALAPRPPAASEQVSSLLRGVLDFFDRRISGSRTARFTAILTVYALDLGLMFYLAYLLRWDFAVPPEFQQQFLKLLVPIVFCKIVLLQSFGQFRSIMSYFGLADLGGVVLAMGIVSSSMLVLWYFSATSAAPPRGVIIADLVLSIGAIAAFRLTLRVARTWCSIGQFTSDATERRVAIIGAGDAGEALVKDLLQRRSSGLRPVLFIDDDPKVIGRSIHGLPVRGPLERLLHLGPIARIDELVITLPGVSPKRLKEIVEVGRRIGAKTQIVPSIVQLASGEVKVERSRPVAIEDLLGRPPVDLNSAGIAQMIEDRVVLVTGAGGSIGSELCRQVLACQPRLLVMVDQVEIALFEIEQELATHPFAPRILPLIADITDLPGIRAVFEVHRPEIVFHAAAHKHVPLMERQPIEALKNNSIGTDGLARLASEYRVARFVFISTDKAINPTSVMGCTKRLAEKALQARQAAPGNTTEFLAVRFGNVLGSSGSVIPTFRRQIAQGGPVTVTHPDMTRYFMTIPEAVGLVLQTATLARGGQLFILDMGSPVKIFDLARQMIELSGYKPGIDIEIQITGIRPGEKLYEELRHTEETHEPTEHPRIFKLRSDHGVRDAADWRAALEAAAAAGGSAEIKQALQRLVPEYSPFGE